MNIEDKLLKEITQYCKLNDIDDVDGLINKMLKIGFDIEKYGPNMSVNKPKVEEKKEEVKVEEPKKRGRKPKEVKEVKIEEPKVVNNKVEEDLYGE